MKWILCGLACFLGVSSSLAQTPQEIKGQSYYGGNPTKQGASVYELGKSKVLAEKLTTPGASLYQLGNSKVLAEKMNELQQSTKSPNSFKVNANPIPFLAEGYAILHQEWYQQVVRESKIKALENKLTQDNVIAKFCTARDPKCITGVRDYGTEASKLVFSKPQQCKSLHEEVAAIKGFNESDVDRIPAAKLPTVAKYYQECTTPDLPENIRKLIGIIVDLGAPRAKSQSGIQIGDKWYFPVGMAVQISPSRVYTARHVLYHDLDRQGRRFLSERDISQLRYIPLTSPTTLLGFVGKHAHPASLIDTLADVPLDQALLQLGTAYIPDNVQWPLVHSLDVIPGNTPTRLYVAGFQMALARSAGVGQANTVVAPGQWKNYIRRDGSQTCTRITQSSDGCMLHGCDTIGGLSGAPIFELTEGATQPVVIGIHNGPAFNTSEICSAGELGTGFNVAALPNASLIQK